MEIQNIDDLPNELLYEIFILVSLDSYQNLYNIALCCKHWCELGDRLIKDLKIETPNPVKPNLNKSVPFDAYKYFYHHPNDPSIVDWVMKYPELIQAFQCDSRFMFSKNCHATILSMFVTRAEQQLHRAQQTTNENLKKCFLKSAFLNGSSEAAYLLSLDLSVSSNLRNRALHFATSKRHFLAMKHAENWAPK